MSEDLAGPQYPAHWEADVVLADGGTAHLRPITAADADRLVAFYGRVSDRSKYNRFFAPYPQLSDRDVERFTQVDHVDRAALILLQGEQMIAVARYERLESRGDAEVAFLVEDAHHGRGVGSVLLEHLAQIARERDVTRFTAEVLAGNRPMISVFRDAGYTVSNQFADGAVHVEFAIRPTDSSLSVTAAREQRAEARSIERLMSPSTIAIVGASRSRDTVGQVLVRNLVLGAFTGPIYAVNPEATAVAGVPAYPSITDVPAPVDLAVIAVSADQVNQVVLDCARHGVKGLVVLSAGFAETGTDEAVTRQHTLVRLARANGMRVVGPNCLGIANTDPTYSMNATLAPVLPAPGRIGLFSQSGTLGPAILHDAAERGLGLSSFVSAGNRADVSGNDLLQYWQDDAATEVILLYLESLGNPRKFSRLTRRVSRDKPVVAVRSGRFAQRVPLGHTVQPLSVPAAAQEAMFRQSGVIRVETTTEMFDVAQVLAYQPLPAGDRVAVVGNSSALCLLTADALGGAGLTVAGVPRSVGPDTDAAAIGQALADALAAPDVDAVVVVFAPLMRARASDDVAHALAAAAEGSTKPVVTSFLGQRGVPAPMRQLGEDGVAERGSVPSYPSPEDAARALGHISNYAAWRRRDPGSVPEMDGCDRAAARLLLATMRAESPTGRVLHPEEVAALLRCYGLTVLPSTPVATVEEAVRAGAAIEGEVVLKATADHLRGRPDLADVWRNIADQEQMITAWTTMTDVLAQPTEAGFVVQQMAGSGVPVVIRAREDRRFGPVVSFGLSGITTELLGDRSYRIPPLTDVDVTEMIREIQAAPLLFGYGGARVVDVAGIEDILHRVSRLIDDQPDVVELDLSPVLVGRAGTTVLQAHARLGPAPMPREHYTRRLP